jgi:hypothetical protein
MSIHVQYLTPSGFVADAYTEDPNIILLSAAQIASPSVAVLRNVTATFQLVVSPFTRYRSDGTQLVLLGEGGSGSPIGETVGGGIPTNDSDAIGGGLPS